MDDLVVLYTIWPDADTAAAAGRAAVEAGLAACANVLGPMRSIYRWQGVMQDDAEIPMLLKTVRSVAPTLTTFILSRHPYTTPCVLALDIVENISNPAFAAWTREQINSGAPFGEFVAP